MRSASRSLIGLTLAVAALTTAPIAAYATSGPGCFQVGNLPAEEPLMLRARPSTGAPVVAKLFTGKHGIIAETGACKPYGVKPSKQWCPVTVYDGDKTMSGWSRLAYLLSSHCP